MYITGNRIPVNMAEYDFMSEFRKVYREKGKYDLKSQIPYLSKLAKIYKNRAKRNPSKNWTDILKAHTLYNSCAVRDEEGVQQEQWEKNAYDVQRQYWGNKVNTTPEEVKSISFNIKQKLDTLRTQLQERLKPVSEQIGTWDCSFEKLQAAPEEPEIPFDLCDTMKSISIHCNSLMVDVSRTVISDAVRLCGDPPCHFSAIGIGSLAKGEATPYSDLEFLFLIEQKSDNITRYFELLAMTTYFIIGNLQETKLKYMDIAELKVDKWFEDEAMSGFKIDGLSEKAGNIPTGSGYPGTKNQFILTPAELSNVYSRLLDNPKPDPKYPGDLTDMLSYTIEICSLGDNNNISTLLQDLNKLKADAKPAAKRQEATKYMLEQDVSSYNYIPYGNNIPSDCCLDLKADIYRYPSIIVHDLKIFYNLHEATTWETLSTLKSLGIFSQSLHDCLLFLLCSAQYIRYSAYLHYNSQKDNISLLLSAGTDKKVSTSEGGSNNSWRLPHNLLFLICRCILPAKLHIACSLQNMTNLSTCLVYGKYEAATGFYQVIGSWSAVIECIYTRFPTETDMDIATLHDLAEAYSGQMDYETHARLISDILRSISDNLDSIQTQKFIKNYGGDEEASLFNLNAVLARSFIKLRKPKVAEEVLKRLESYKKTCEQACIYETLQGLLRKQHSEVPRSVDVFGSAVSECESDHNMSGQALPALTFRAVHDAKLSQSYENAGAMQKAEKCLHTSLRSLKELYGEDSRHDSMWSVYFQLSHIAIKNCDYDEASHYLTIAQKMCSPGRNQVYTGIGFGRMEMGQKEYKKAIRSFIKAIIEMENQRGLIFEASEIGETYLELGMSYLFLEKYSPAILNLQKSERNLNSPLRDGTSDTGSTAITECKYYFAQVYFKTADFGQSLNSLRSAFSLISQGITHPRGSIPSFMNDAIKTLKSLSKALSAPTDNDKAMFRQCYMSLFYLYSKRKDVKLATKYFNEAAKYED